MSTDIANLRRLIALADARLDEVTAETAPFDSQNYGAWRAGYDALVERLIIIPFCAHEGAAFSQRGSDQYAVRMAGIRSTSTSGYESALHNWRKAAVMKVQREERA